MKCTVGRSIPFSLDVTWMIIKQLKLFVYLEPSGIDIRKPKGNRIRKGSIFQIRTATARYIPISHEIEYRVTECHNHARLTIVRYDKNGAGKSYRTSLNYQGRNRTIVTFEAEEPDYPLFLRPIEKIKLMWLKHRLEEALKYVNQTGQKMVNNNPRLIVPAP